MDTTAEGRPSRGHAGFRSVGGRLTLGNADMGEEASSGDERTGRKRPRPKANSLAVHPLTNPELLSNFLVIGICVCRVRA